MKKIISLLLILSQVSYAGLPPASVKGQTDASATTKFQIQTPHNQITNLGGIKALIETGNNNILPDPGFEAATSLWTFSGGATATTDSTAKGTGSLGADWDSNAAGQTLTSQLVTIPTGFQGKNGVALCNIKTPSGTATHTITVNDGSVDIGTPGTILSGTTFLTSSYNFIYPLSGGLKIKLTSVSSNEPQIFTDDCKLDLATNVGLSPISTPTTAYTPTFTGIGTPTAVSFFYSRQGDLIHVSGYLITGTTTATKMSMTLPGALALDPAKIGVANTSAAAGQFLGSYGDDGSVDNAGYVVSATGTSTSLVYFGNHQNSTSILTPQNGNNIVTSSNALSIDFWAPIAGWSTGSAVSADQADYDWIPYTPTFTGFGTVTSIECQQSRLSSNLLIRCKAVSGTSTATEARVSLPNSLTSADTIKIPSIQMAGLYLQGATDTSHGGAVLIEPSTAYVTFGSAGTLSNSSINPLTKANGSSAIAAGATLNFNATIPIQGWISNQRAPALIGSVTNNSSSAKNIIAFTFAGASETTACTGTCTLYGAGGDPCITSVTRSTTGKYIANFLAGCFSSAPRCVVSGDENIGGFIAALDRTAGNSATAIGIDLSTAVSLTDGVGSAVCFGTR